MSQILDSTTDGQQRREKAKPKYNPLDSYQKNAYVDCKDSVNSWCLARILERCDDDNTLRVSFDGWSHKWDEWLRFTTTRLAPFRKFSFGYSGQTKVAIRDWKFSLAELKLRTEKLREYIDSDFTILKTPMEITQYLRGSEFVYVDCLLQNEYQNPKQELPYVFKYLEVCFELYISFLKLIPDYIPEYLEGITNIDSFLTNERIALILCLSEVSEMINFIFGGSDRLWSNFKTYDSEAYKIVISDSTEYAGKNIETIWTGDKKEEATETTVTKREYSKLICHLVNKFGEAGVIRAWIDAFTYCREDEGNNINSIQLPPFRMMETLIKTLTNIYPYLNRELAKSLMPSIKDAITRRLCSIPDKEIKEIDRDDLTKFIGKSQFLLQHHYSKDQVYEITENAELSLDLRFLTCAFLEKRLRGLTRIKEFAEKIDGYEQAAKYLSQGESVLSPSKRVKHISAKTFIKWMFENKIFEFIFGDSIHIEMIKRTPEILKFIANYETVPLHILQIIWNACEGKHEALLIGLYDLIIEISGYLDHEGIRYLKSQIESIPDEHQNEMTLKLIKGFAENTLPRFSAINSDQESEEVDESRYSCMTTLWHLMLDQSKVNRTISEHALNTLANILREPACQPLRKLYLFRCFDKIQERDSVSQCINLIHSILNTQYYNHKYDPKTSLGLILEQLDNQYGIIKLLVDEIEDFYRKTAEIVKRDHPNQVLTDEMRNKTYKGKYPYLINLNNRFVFLEYMTNNQAYELTLTIDQIESIWDLFTINPLWEFDKELFFNWISIRHEGQAYAKPTSVISKDLLPELFEKILCNHRKFDFVNMSPRAFECFVSHLKAVNEAKGKFRVDRGQKFIVLNLNYFGKETLWNLFVNCRNEKTTKSILHLLVECNLQLAPSLDKKKKELWENFTNQCISLLKEGQEKQDEMLISKAMQILTQFFDRFEGKHGLEIGKEDVLKYGYFIRVTVVLKPDTIVKSLFVNNLQTMGYLKGLIADKFGFFTDEIEVSIKGIPIENDEDTNSIQNYNLTEPCFVQRVQSTSKQEGGYHPKQIIADNAESIDLLFKLLSENLQVLNIIWDLLMRLPVSEKTKQSIYQIDDSWENLLGRESIQQYRLLYCLQIIDEILFGKEKAYGSRDQNNLTDASKPFNDPQWAQRFYQTGGLRTLLNIFLNSELLNIKSLITLQCLAIILKISAAYFSKYNSEIAQDEEVKKLEPQIPGGIVNIIHNVCMHSLLRDPKLDVSAEPFVKVYSVNGDEFIRVSEDLHFESEVIFYAQHFILLLIQINPVYLNTIYYYSNLRKLLAIGLVETGNLYLKEKLSNGLLNLILQQTRSGVSVPPQQILVPILLQDTLQIALDNQDKSSVFFRMVTNLISKVNIGEISLDADNLLHQLVDFLRLKRPLENGTNFDVVLHGTLLLLKELFTKYTDKALKFGQEEGLVQEVLFGCLFDFSRRIDKNEVAGSKCKNAETRSAAFKLLAELAKHSTENLQEILNYVLPIHKQGKWRTKRYIDWSIEKKDNDKSATGYVGLKNPGCICYMNSTIQQLYMIPTFRNAILEVEDKQLNSGPKEDNLLHQFKCIFAALNESEKQAVNPKGFCYAFKDWDGNPTNIFEQMDADEFFNAFMDRLENQIKNTKYEQMIKQHFGGVLSNELICKSCPHYSEREEPFLAVSLQVKNKKNIYQSLSAFIEGEMLEGDNAYFCAECDKKVNTLKRVCLKRLPNQLILALKRFEFDYETMTKVKVNDYCEFPMKLDFEPYTQQGLRKADRAKQQQENKEGEQESPKIENEQPHSYFEYKLTGIVLHMGFADSGHYISLIQDREYKGDSEDGRWYEFNDNDVRIFDPKDIPSDAFGGEEKWKQYTAQTTTGNQIKEKIKNAYLLIYERIVPVEESQPSQPVEAEPTGLKAKKEEDAKDQDDHSSTSTSASTHSIDRPPSQLKYIRSDKVHDRLRKPEIECKMSEDMRKNFPNDFLTTLLDKNEIFQIYKSIFTREYFNFIMELVSQRQYTPSPEYNSERVLDPIANSTEYYDLELIKFGVTFFLTSIIREKQRTGIIDFLPLLKAKISQNISAAVWVIKNFSSKKSQLEFFLDCPVADMRRFVVGLVSFAFQTIYNYKTQKDGYVFAENSDQKGDQSLVLVLSNFINCTINLIFESRISGREYTEFFTLLYNISTAGEDAANYLIVRRVIGRLMDFHYDRMSSFNEVFRDMSAVPYTEPESIEFGESQEEKRKIRNAWEEFMFRKNNKNAIESYNYKSYLWKTVSHLIRFCRVNNAVERSPWQIGTYDHQLSSQEEVLLMPSAGFVQQVIGSTDSKISRRSVAKIYSYLSYEYEIVSKSIVEAIKLELNSKEYTSFKAAFCCITTLLSLNDSLTQSRVTEVCELLVGFARENATYYLEMDTLTTFLLKITSKLNNVRTWFVNNIDSWSWIMNLLYKYPVPPINGPHDGLELQKRRSNLQTPNLPYKLQEYRARTNIKLRRFQKLANGEQEEPDAWDSDDDMADHQFRLEERIDYYSRRHGKWVTAAVCTLLEELINLHICPDEKEIEKYWYSRDIDIIAPYGSMQKLQFEVDAESSRIFEAQTNMNNQNLQANGNEIEQEYEGNDDTKPDNLNA